MSELLSLSTLNELEKSQIKLIDFIKAARIAAEETSSKFNFTYAVVINSILWNKIKVIHVHNHYEDLGWVTTTISFPFFIEDSTYKIAIHIEIDRSEKNPRITVHRHPVKM